ncbi:hypothetical protein ABZ951_15580 [Streptomyces sp. NPDC046215]|uniref:DNA-binding protein n=1 Tax=Streptomyces stramineus TaxID=173861 RepID=A0ABP3JUG1_9ACTN
MTMTNAQREAYQADVDRLTRRFRAFAHEIAGVRPRRLGTQPLSPLTAVSTVAEAVDCQRPDVDTEDLRAALRLLSRARRSMEFDELMLLARAKQDFTWDEIGALTGIGDRRLAHQRYTRLRDRLAPNGLDIEDADVEPGTPQNGDQS